MLATVIFSFLHRETIIRRHTGKRKMATEPYNRLAGKHVLILGATSGLGYAVAKAALAATASLTISSSSAERIDATIHKLHARLPNSEIKGYACNLAGENVEQEIEQLLQRAEAGSGKVDHIIYTAANSLPVMPVQDITREKIISAGQLRFVAPILVAKIGSRYLSSGPESSITFTSGTIAEHPSPNWTLMAGYMGGISSATRNLALDLKPIRVNAVSPGLVDTELWNQLVPNAEEKAGMFQHLAQKHPTGRVAKPEDLAESYLYLMKDINITGQIINSDSGALLM
jgi:NAD(P)-dependent dehydrogenase (short-subunit alcohol dehydrogenase family)